MSADVLSRCATCDGVARVPAGEVDLGCQFCATWPDGFRATIPAPVFNRSRRRAVDAVRGYAPAPHDRYLERIRAL